MKALFILSILFILFNFEYMPPFYRAAMVKVNIVRGGHMVYTGEMEPLGGPCPGLLE